MSKRPALTLAYLTHAPGSAAKVMEEIDCAASGAFIEEVPARLAAPVVEKMSPWCGARCLENVSPPRAAAILHRLSFHDAAGLLRLIPPDLHDDILEALPSRHSWRMRGALKYPAGSVGAWIDPDVPTFARHVTVREALRYLRQSRDISHVFLHNVDKGLFAGTLPLPLLLRSNPDARLDELSIVEVRPLSSHATLASVMHHEAWDEFLLLPVVGRGNALVGGLSRASLRRGLIERSAPYLPSPGTVPGQLLGALATTYGGLLRLVFTSDLEAKTHLEERDHG